MATFTVTNTNNSGVGSLRQAVIDANNANGADKIVFDSSLSGSTINLTSGQMRITESLTLEGLGAENLTIDAGGNSRVFLVADTSVAFASDIDFTVEGLTITGGSTSGNGGAILAADGILNDVNVTISNSSIVGNSAANDGGAIYFKSKQGEDGVRIENSSISENSAGNAGGGVFADEIRISESTFSENSAFVGGGGVFTLGVASVNGSTFVENTTSGFGGGIAGRVIKVLTSTFSHNRAGIEGGGIRTEGAAVIINSNISENEADENGGGISVSQLFQPTLPGGDRTTVISNTTISGNKAKGDGGGIQVVGGKVQLVPFGSTIQIPANLVATNVTIANNVADSDNDGVGDGGGISNFPSEVVGDFETERFILSPGEITFKNSIIAGNFDTPNNNGIGFIAPDIDGAARGNANNLLGNTQGLTIESSVASASESLGAGSDLSDVDPRLGILQDNGGPTQTIELLPGSPAIDAGNNNNIIRETISIVDGLQPLVFNFDGDPNTPNAQIPFDQRQSINLFSRIVNGTVDIGAFEVQTVIPDNLNLRSTSSNDSLTSAEGNDTLTGLAGNDLLIGNDGRDRLVGGNGKDTLDGGNDRDTLLGGSGRDLLSGGVDPDVLRGGSGNDTLTGGAGNDVLRGDAGRDVLVLEIGQGRDTIRNFQDGIDRLGLSDGLSFSDLTIASNGAGTSTIIRDSNNNTIATLPDFDSTLITEVDFVEI